MLPSSTDISTHILTLQLESNTSPSNLTKFHSVFNTPPCISDGPTSKRQSFANINNPFNSKKFSLSSQKHINTLPQTLNVNLIPQRLKGMNTITPLNLTANYELKPKQKNPQKLNILIRNFQCEKKYPQEAKSHEINNNSKGLNASNELEKNVQSSARIDKLTQENTSTFQKKKVNVEYFALVNSICKNHQIFNKSNSSKVITDPSSQSMQSQESQLYEYPEEVLSDQRSISSSKINFQLKKLLTRKNGSKDKEDNYILTKAKWISDRKWLSKNKTKILAENKVSTNVFYIPPVNSQISLQHISMNPSKQDSDSRQHAIHSLAQKSDYYFDNSISDNVEISGYKSLLKQFTLEESENQTSRKNIYSIREITSPRDIQQNNPIDVYPFSLHKQGTKEIQPFSNHQSSQQNTKVTLSSVSKDSLGSRDLISLCTFSKKGGNYFQGFNSNKNGKFNEQISIKVDQSFQQQQQQENEKCSLISENKLINETYKKSQRSIISLCTRRDRDLSDTQKQQSKIEDMLFNTDRNVRGGNSESEYEKTNFKMQMLAKQSSNKKKKIISKQINTIQDALNGRGLLDEEEIDDIVGIKIRIQNYFRQSHISQQDKEKIFNQLEQQFSIDNIKQNQQLFSITSMLRNMKSFFLNSPSNYNNNSNNNKYYELDKQIIKQQLEYQSQSKCKSTNDLLFSSKQNSHK